jgi:hypothetical protein
VVFVDGRHTEVVAFKLRSEIVLGVLDVGLELSHALPVSSPDQLMIMNVMLTMAGKKILRN